jgi:hypothetical protein
MFTEAQWISSGFGRSISRHWAQRLAQFPDVGHDGITHEAHVLYGTFGGSSMTVFASVLDDDRDEAKVSPVAHRGVL